MRMGDRVIKAGDTYLTIFRPRPTGRYVLVVGDFVPVLRHKVQRRSPWRGGKKSVSHIPCCKKVISKEPEPGRVIFLPGPEPCPACREAGRGNRSVWCLEFYYPCLVGQLQRDDDEEDIRISEESVLIWYLTPKQLERLQTLGVEAWKTRIRVERGPRWNSRIAIAIYDGPHLPIRHQFRDHIREIEESNALEQSFEPPSFEDLKRILEARLEALEPGGPAEFRAPGRGGNG